MAYARISNFYGFDLNTIESMEMGRFIGYLKAIDIIKAENAIVSLDISAYPHIKDDKKRAELRKKFIKVAQPDRLKHGISFTEFARKQENGI